MESICSLCAGLRRIGAVALLVFVTFVTGCATVPEPTVPVASLTGGGLLLIAHGYGNNPTQWPARLIKEIRTSGVDLSSWDIYAHDWEAQADRPLTAARSGYRIGRDLARQIVASGDPYRVIHLVGQSLGAHLTQGFADEYRSLGGGAFLYMTFLDPFLMRGVFGIGYGVRHFGVGADFAENFIVRHEPVVGSNRYLHHAYNTDISAVVPKALRDDFFGPHWWVVEYYRQSVNGVWPGFLRSPLPASSRATRIGEDVISAYFAGLRESFPPGERVVLGPPGS